MILLALIAVPVSAYLLWNAARRRNPIEDLRQRLADWVDGFDHRPLPAARDAGDDLDDPQPIDSDPSTSND